MCLLLHLDFYSGLACVGFSFSEGDREREAYLIALDSGFWGACVYLLWRVTFAVHLCWLSDAGLVTSSISEGL